MKYIKKHIKVLAGSSLLLVLLFACAKFEDFSSTNPTLGVPTVEINVVSIQDSSVTVSATSNMEGFLAIAVLDGSDVNEYNHIAVLTNNVGDVLAYSSSDVDAGGSVTASFIELTQNTSYRVIAVANNAEGNTSEVVELSFLTDDTYSPALTGIDPGIGTDAIQALDFAVTLLFDEPVRLGDASLIQFGYLSLVDYSTTWIEATDADITVSGDMVTIQQSVTPDYRKYVFLNIDSLAILDVVGNAFGGVESYLDLGEGALYGLFWRTEATEYPIADVSPAVGDVQTDAGFQVELTFDVELDLGSNYSEGGEDPASVVFTYMQSNGSTLIFPVPADNISFSGTTVTIAQPHTPDPGDIVYLSVEPGAFADENGNSNSAYETEDGWLISKGLTVDLVIGTYEATCVSYFTSDVYVYTITIVEDPDVEDGVIMSGFEYSDSLIYGTFDGIWGQITIPSYQSFGDLLGDGSDIVIDAGYADETIPVIAEVAINGDITCTWGSLVVGGVNDGFYWDYYENTSWEKQTTKSGSIHLKKIEPKVPFILNKK